MASSPPPPEEPEAQPKESPATKARFETFDANKDGSLRGEEIVKMLTAMGCASASPQSHSNGYAPYRTFRGGSAISEAREVTQVLNWGSG